jgi:hypothetical protein
MAGRASLGARGRAEPVVTWLLRDGEVLASVEVVGSLPDRLLGSRALESKGSPPALVIRPARVTHTLAGRGPVDVAFLDGELVVVAVRHLGPGRVALPHARSRAILLARSGAFERWRLGPGDQLELTGVEVR